MFNQNSSTSFQLVFGFFHHELHLFLCHLFVSALFHQCQFVAVESIPTTPMFALRAANEKFRSFLVQVLDSPVFVLLVW